MNSSPGYYDDDDCHSVQLEGSDMTPRAAKVRLFLHFKTNTGATGLNFVLYRQSYGKDLP
jgi:hypothetical protein